MKQEVAYWSGARCRKEPKHIFPLFPAPFLYFLLVFLFVCFFFFYFFFSLTRGRRAPENG